MACASYKRPVHVVGPCGKLPTVRVMAPVSVGLDCDVSCWPRHLHLADW